MNLLTVYDSTADINTGLQPDTFKLQRKETADYYPFKLVK